MLLILWLAMPPTGVCAATPSWLNEVMARLAQAPNGRARFVEQKQLAALRGPVTSEGTLSYRKPGHLEKITTTPSYESLVVDGDRLVISGGGNQAPRVVELDGQPEIAAVVDTIRAAVAGDLALLARLYTVSATGNAQDWSVVLHPRDPAVAALVREVRLGGGAQLRSIETVAPNGDTDTLTITPVG